MCVVFGEVDDFELVCLLVGCSVFVGSSVFFVDDVMMF